jgi:hypothetical protein
LGLTAFLAVLMLAMVAGCSPEADRTRSGGRGADIGNSVPPIQLHGNRARNNPEYRTPSLGRAPRDAKGVPGWWTSRAE